MTIETLNLGNIKIPRILFTTKAYLELQALIQTKYAQDREFMIIGEVTKKDFDYIIEHLRVIPQCKNSPVYCETDDEKYAGWLAENYKPNERYKIRLNGHSHVRMATSPSGVDDENILNMMNYVDDYFIQMIFNLKEDITLNLYSKTDLLIYKKLPYGIIFTNGIVYDITNKKLNNFKPLTKYNITYTDTKINILDNVYYDMTKQTLIVSDEYYKVENNLLSKTLKDTTFNNLVSDLENDLQEYAEQPKVKIKKTKNSNVTTKEAYNDYGFSEINRLF